MRVSRGTLKRVNDKSNEIMPSLIVTALGFL